MAVIQMWNRSEEVYHPAATICFEPKSTGGASCTYFSFTEYWAAASGREQPQGSRIGWNWASRDRAPLDGQKASYPKRGGTYVIY